MYHKMVRVLVASKNRPKGTSKILNQSKVRNLWRWISKIRGAKLYINPLIGDTSLDKNVYICEHLVNSKGS